MPRRSLSRRELIEACLAGGVLAIAPPLGAEALAALWEEQEPRAPTPPNALGPFYKKRAPRAEVLRAPGDPGLPLRVAGRVFDTRGEALPDSTIEVWHADHLGHYDLEGYRYRSTLTPDEKGGYRFETVMPGHYPGRVAQHVHYLVSAPGHKTLVTQLYFATDPVFEGDPDRNANKDPLVHSRELIRPVLIGGDPKSTVASVSFELCLERA